VQKRQIPMDTSRIRTVGVSILRQDGDFEIEIDWIKAMNTKYVFCY
jgi:NADH dehydrogenase [ubiquinone] 1 alpha subcomplex assembly factor 1